MTSVFTKRSHRVDGHFFATEAAGLRWLKEAKGAPVAQVLDVGSDYLEIERILPSSPTRTNAEQFGRLLVTTHTAGAKAFGAKPPNVTQECGYIGPTGDALPMPYGEWSQWGTYFADARIQPYLDLLIQQRHLTSSQQEVMERLILQLKEGEWDDTHIPARLHGDLWSGNLIWSEDGAVMIDPAACGGHPVDDLAMLAVFSAPYLDSIYSGYEARASLEPGWQQRIALHQVYPLLVHAVLFGSGYLDQAIRNARHYVG